MGIGIYNINLLCDKDTSADYKWKKFAEQIQKVANSHGAHWDLIGMNEAPVKEYVDWGDALAKKYRARLISNCGQCPPATKGFPVTFPRCLLARLRNQEISQAELFGLSSIHDNAYQIGEIAVISNQDSLTRVGDVQHRQVGISFHNTLKRRVVGSRYRIKNGQGAGYHFPFYSTHISAPPSSNWNRKTQLKAVIKFIKKNFRSGDLTPVLVGDFNFHRSNTEFWGLLEKDFVYGQKKSRIEQLWIGKQNSFPGSIGALRVGQTFHFDEEFRDLKTGTSNDILTDHAVPYAELEAPEEDCLPVSHSKLRVIKRNGRHKIAQGASWLYSFRHYDSALRLVNFLKQIRVNRICHCARPNPSVEYLFGSGTPKGSGRIVVTSISDKVHLAPVPTSRGVRYRILSGDISVADVSTYGLASRVLELVKRHKFQYRISMVPLGADRGRSFLYKKN